MSRRSLCDPGVEDLYEGSGDGVCTAPEGCGACPASLNWKTVLTGPSVDRCPLP